MSVVLSRTVRQDGEVVLKLPKEVAFEEGVQVRLVRAGDILTVSPASPEDMPSDEPNGARLVRKLRELPAPSCIQERDVETIPEPKGLFD